MGINKNLFEFMEKACQEIDIKFDNCRICELGNQVLGGGFDSYTKGPRTTAKTYLESFGVEHVSIDINGRDGALPLDLSEPIEKFLGYFDIVTNYGTSEHVKNQYNVFRNMHNFVRVGGALINGVPPEKGWEKHDCFFYYELEFFQELAKRNNYRLIFQDLILGTGSGSPVVFTVAIREKADAFISQEEFKSIKGIKFKD